MVLNNDIIVITIVAMIISVTLLYIIKVNNTVNL